VATGGLLDADMGYVGMPTGYMNPAAANPWRQLAAVFGEQEARALFGLTNVLVMFGGSKDGGFNQEISDLVDQTRVSRRTWQTGTMAGRTFSGEDIAIIRPEEIRRLQERRALVIAENAKPIIARLSRCIDGRTGGRLLAGEARLRARLADRHSAANTAEARAAAALIEAGRRGIAADPGSYR
jgi:type IV secretion system protein VirD4